MERTHCYTNLSSHDTTGDTFVFSKLNIPKVPVYSCPFTVCYCITIIEYNYLKLLVKRNYVIHDGLIVSALI